MGEHILSALSSFITIEKKYDVFRGKGFMQTFCEFLREHAVKMINF